MVNRRIKVSKVTFQSLIQVTGVEFLNVSFFVAMPFGVPQLS